MRRLVDYLCLSTKPVRSMKDRELLDILLLFNEDTTAYRLKMKADRKKEKEMNATTITAHGKRPLDNTIDSAAKRIN